MTQVTWDAWVEVPMETATELGLRRGDLVKLTSPHGSIELPAYPSESLHPGAVAVATGQGHGYAGAYARQRGLNVGANPVALLGGAADPASGGLPYLAVKVTLAKTGARRPLAIPQATFRPGRPRDRPIRGARRGEASSSCAAVRPSTRATPACTRPSSIPSIAGA